MNISRLFLSIFLVTVLFSCSNKNKLGLSETNCRDEVPAIGNLTFLFDKNLAPDSLLERWVDEEYIVFKPAIKGKFQWKNANELIFSPESGLAPSTAYTASFEKSLVKHTKFSVSALEDLEFHTPWLTLSSGTAIWVGREAASADIVPEINLEFNYDIKPSEILENLQLKNGSDALDLKLVSNDKGRFVHLRVNNLKAEDKDLNLKLVLDKGLKPVGGNVGTTEKMEVDILLPSPFNLVISNQEADHDGITGTVRLYSSQKISTAIPLKDFISLEPSVKFKVSIVEDGLVLTSEDFDLTKSYQITLKKGLEGSIGGTLKEDYVNSIVFGKLEPSISFMDAKGVYLASKGRRNLEVKINNVSEIKVTISKIYENNLLNARRNGYYPGNSEYDYEEYENENVGTYYGDDYDYQVGDIVYEKEIVTKSLAKRGSSRIFHFDFPDALKEFKGIYHIQISSKEEYYLRDSKYISLSDLGIIARQSKNKVYVFVNSIVSTASLSGVNLVLYGNNNQQIGNASTNSEGYAEINLNNKNIRGFKPAMIVAKTGNDFNYLPFNSTMVETSRFDIGGVRQNATGLRAFIYGDRDIYRPGEKMNFSAIVRNEQWVSPGSIPIKMKILLPNGKDLKVLKKSINEQGSTEASIDLSPAAVSGHYTLEVYTSNDVLLASKTILVEEFMPDRIKVKAELNRPFYKPGDSMRLRLNAVNFFGPPAANRGYECEIQVKERAFQSKNFSKYNFNLSNTEAYYESVTFEGTTDANGNASESYGIPGHFKDRGILQADFFTTVFDETGRPVSRAAHADIMTQDIFFGVNDNGYSYHALNQPVRFGLVALNKDDKVLNNAVARIVIIKKEYRTVLSRAGEYFRYESQSQLKTLEDKLISINGSNSYYQFVPRSPGDYEIRIARPGSNTYVSSGFYSYGMWGDYGSGFEVNREGNIDIETDRQNYQSDQSAKILFKTPFNGKMLVTIEADEVLEYHYVDVKNRSASLTVSLSEKSIPNIYITATLIKPHTESEMPLTVAHGYKPINVEQLSRKIPVKIIASQNSRSRTKQKVTVKAIPGCKVTLAAVDEGILQLTNYKTPDPYAFFYAKKALEINAFDLYPLLLPEIKNAISFTGGDGYDLSKRVNPLPNKRVKLVSSWSGITDASSGEVNFEIDIPQFSGEIRLMAVAYKEQRFGSAEERIKVADPIVISTSLPRFLSPGDTVLIPVTVTNTTAKNTSGKVTLSWKGALRLLTNNVQSISLKPNAESRVMYTLVADAKTEACKINVEVNALGEKFVEENDITIRPSASVQKAFLNGSIASGTTKKLNLLTGNFIPSSTSKQLIISRSPIVEFGDQLKNLIQYPYGCTEQTVSAAFPQLYYGDLADLMNLKENGRAFANYNVQEAIRKIKTRQLYNGAVTLWDGEGTESWWATVYSAHFLLEAKKAGYDNDADLINKMLEYLSNRVRSRTTVPYYYNGSLNKQIAPKEMAYSLFVLALAGKPEIGTMNYYKQNTANLALDSRYLLSAAYAIAGDRSKFNELLPKSFTGEIAVKENGGSFASDVRDEAIALYAIMEVDPGNTQAGVMAAHVSTALKSRQYLSTQERAFGLLALGKIARETAGNTSTASIKADGKVVANFSGKTMVIDNRSLQGKELEITVAGKGKLYYTYQSSGISATGEYKEEDNFIKVRKQFFDRRGNPIQGRTFKQNDLIIIAITVDKSYSSAIENVVITDMLPAGFEIENPRIREIPGMSWIKNDYSPTHRDIRDDRVNLFVDLYQLKQTYYYAVRAVSPGNFKMGSVMADAMYQGEIHSYHGAGMVRVVGK